MSKILEEANTLGLEVLDKLIGSNAELHTRFEGKALNPAVLASAKALVFLKAVHGGLVVGGLHATGFLIALTPKSTWSAPCFVTLNRIEIGAVAGIQTAHMLMASVTRNGLMELASGGKHQTFGSDISFQFWPFSTSKSGPDDYASLDVTSDWIIAQVAQGVLFDFSLSGSSLAVDHAKNKRVYGDAMGHDPGNIILREKVPRPPEMVPLYRKISEISSRALE